MNDNASTYTDLSSKQTPTQPHERNQYKEPEHDFGWDIRIPASMSNIETVKSGDSIDHGEFVAERRPLLLISHSNSHDSPQKERMKDSQSKAGLDRHDRHDHDSTGDTWILGADAENPKQVTRVGREPQKGTKRRVRDEDGDEDYRLTSQPKRLSKRHGPFRRSVLRASSADESDGESDQSSAVPIRRRSKRLSRQHLTPGPTSPKGLSNGDETTSTSDVDPDCLELPIRGFLGIRMVGSKTFYALNFCQDLSQRGPSPGRRTCTETRRGASGSPRVEKTRPVPQPPGRGSRFTQEEDDLLIELKRRRGLPWEDIKPHFPERSVGTLQVRYSTKLKAGTGKRCGRGRR